MCTHSHLVGYIKTMYSLMAVQIRHCHWMFMLVEILCHSIHGFFLFLINVECLSFPVILLALAVLAFCLLVFARNTFRFLQLSAFLCHLVLGMSLTKILYQDLCFLKQLTVKSFSLQSLPLSKALEMEALKHF